MRSFAILPCAGRSRRMGAPKLLLPWQGLTLIEHVLGAWLAAGVTRLTAVARRDDGELVALLGRYDLDLVIPEEDPAEMRFSVETALRYIARQYAPADDDCWLLAPADVPHISAGVISRLLREFERSRPSILAPAQGARRGHPTAFAWRLSAEVFRLPPELGVNALLQRFPVALMETPEADLKDVDTPDDYHGLRDAQRPER